MESEKKINFLKEDIEKKKLSQPWLTRLTRHL